MPNPIGEALSGYVVDHRRCGCMAGAKKAPRELSDSIPLLSPILVLVLVLVLDLTPPLASVAHLCVSNRSAALVTIAGVCFPSASATVSSPVPNGYHTIGDLDGDGKPEIVFPNRVFDAT